MCGGLHAEFHMQGQLAGIALQAQVNLMHSPASVGMQWDKDGKGAHGQRHKQGVNSSGPVLQMAQELTWSILTSANLQGGFQSDHGMVSLRQLHSHDAPAECCWECSLSFVPEHAC